LDVIEELEWPKCVPLSNTFIVCVSVYLKL
jgi:hypothetical protein